MNRSSSLSLYAAIAVLGLAVAGCAPLGLTKPGASAQTAPTSQTGPTPQSSPAPSQAGPPEITPLPLPPPPPPPPPPSPDTLIGLGTAALRAQLGTPELIRRERPAEVWLYEGPACVLHVFFYPAKNDSGLHVTDVEATAVSAGGTVDRGACFTALLKATVRPAKPKGAAPSTVPPDF